MACAPHTPHYQDESAKQKEEGNEHVSVKTIQAGRRELLAASKAVKRPGFYLELRRTGNGSTELKAATLQAKGLREACAA